MRRISELFSDPHRIIRKGSESFLIHNAVNLPERKKRINVLALGDVGGTLSLALTLCGRDCIGEIGLCDLQEPMVQRYEMELNQIVMPDQQDAFPPAVPCGTDALFDGDVFVFCASRGVPPVSETGGDVRMVQLESNLRLVRQYAAQAVRNGYRGLFFVVSDPVDPLCKGALMEGLSPGQVQGFGLGVMHGRAAYYARKEKRFRRYLTEGRVYGPHGSDLVVADSVFHYDPVVSESLTQKTVQSNLRVRALGFKPYLAPAVSSGALAILSWLRGDWHYSSAYFGKGDRGAFLGMRNRRTSAGLEVEDLPLEESLFERIQTAYRNLENLL